MTTNRRKPPPSPDDLAALVDAFERSDRPKRGDAFADGGLDALFPRLTRAAVNQLEGGGATLSRYGIWANGVRDHIAEAMVLVQNGDADAALRLLVRAHNALAAFSELQGRLATGGEP